MLFLTRNTPYYCAKDVSSPVCEASRGPKASVAREGGKRRESPRQASQGWEASVAKVESKRCKSQKYASQKEDKALSRGRCWVGDGFVARGSLLNSDAFHVNGFKNVGYKVCV